MSIAHWQRSYHDPWAGFGSETVNTSVNVLGHANNSRWENWWTLVSPRQSWAGEPIEPFAASGAGPPAEPTDTPGVFTARPPLQL